MKKPRNRKYNPDKQLQKNADALVQDSAIFQLPEQKCNFVHVPTCSLIGTPYIKRSLARAYTRSKYQWVVALMVFKIDERGDKAIEVHHVSPNEPCLADAIADSVETKHNHMIGKVSKREFVAAGWLAIPRSEYLSSKFLFELFDKMGVWTLYITDPETGYKLNNQ